MNEAIINPLWIYLIETGSTVGLALTLISSFFAVFVGISAIVYVIWKFTEYDEDYESDVEADKKVRSKLIKCIIGALVAIIFSCAIPSEKTMYTMFAASHITEENIDKAGNTVTDMVDYIFDKVDELQDDEVQEDKE